MTVYGVQPQFYESVSNVTATLGDNSPEVGQLRFEGDEIYRFVYNNGGEQIDPTYGAVIDYTSNVTGYSVTITSTTSTDMFVGLVKHATLTTATYGWLLVHGFCTVEMEADNSCVTGALLAPAANGEFALKSNSTGYPANAVGQALESIASGASGEAFVKMF